MSDEAIPESDRIEGAPHPRDTQQLFGQEAAERTILSALNSGRMHHAWLLTGPKGVGKATLGWRMTQTLLTMPSDDAGLFGDAPSALSSLDVNRDHPVARRVAAGAEPRLLHIRRSWDTDRKKLRAQIVVDDIRRLGGFFGLSSVDGGRRVVLLDCADDMNASAANALLKVLEEPPADAVLILISHQPARLLPTIRSRCREVRLHALSPDAVAASLKQAGVDVDNPDAIAALSGGSAGDALMLLQNDGITIYAAIIELLSGCPNIDRSALLKLAEKSAARGAEARFDLTLRLLDLALVRMARTGSGKVPEMQAHPDEATIFQKLSANPDDARKWATLQQELSGQAAHARAVNIDPQSLMLSLFLKINDAAASRAA